MRSPCHAVSIHAFREEGDSRRQQTRCRAMRFNPRLPGGRRRVGSSQPPRAVTFQSTPSGRKATQTVPAMAQPWQFQSTPSGRKATAFLRAVRSLSDVSIHAFREEGDAVGAKHNPIHVVSIHAFREEGDFGTEG